MRRRGGYGDAPASVRRRTVRGGRLIVARWKLARGVLVVGVGAAAAGVMVGGANDNEADADASDTPVEQDTAEVTRRDLARSEELDGTIDFGTATSLVLAASGVITDLPNVGEVIRN